jgi:hypothetical protein
MVLGILVSVFVAQFHTVFIVSVSLTISTIVILFSSITLIAVLPLVCRGCKVLGVSAQVGINNGFDDPVSHFIQYTPHRHPSQSNHFTYIYPSSHISKGK